MAEKRTNVQTKMDLWIDNELKSKYVEYIVVQERDSWGFEISHFDPSDRHITDVIVTENDIPNRFLP